MRYCGAVHAVRGAGGAGARASVGDEGNEAGEGDGGRDANAIVASTGGIGSVDEPPYRRWWFSTVARNAFFRISMRTYSMCTGTYLPGDTRYTVRYPLSRDCGRPYALKLGIRHAFELDWGCDSKCRFAKVSDEATTRIDHVCG